MLLEMEVFKRFCHSELKIFCSLVRHFRSSNRPSRIILSVRPRVLISEEDIWSLNFRLTRVRISHFSFFVSGNVSYLIKRNLKKKLNICFRKLVFSGSNFFFQIYDSHAIYVSFSYLGQHKLMTIYSDLQKAFAIGKYIFE